MVAAVGLQEIAVGLLLGEGTEHDIIGIEVGIACTDDRVDAQRVAPDGVLPDVGGASRTDNPAAKGHHLALLAVFEVAVGILQCIGPVLSGRHTTDDEASPSVGS